MRAKLLATLFLLTGMAVGQGVQYRDAVTNQYGVPTQASVKVCTSSAVGVDGICTSPATIYSDAALSSVKINPFATDLYGQYSFYAARGIYYVQVYGTGLTAGIPQQVSLPSAGTSTDAGSIQGKAVAAPSAAGTLLRYNGTDIDWQAKAVLDVRDFLGATPDVQLNDCIVAAMASTGICDARALTGTQTLVAEVDVGNHAQTPVTLLIPNRAATWNVDIKNGTSCGMKVFGDSAVIGDGPGQGLMLRNKDATTSVDSLLCTEDSPTGGGQYVRIEGITVYNSNATFATGAVNWRHTFDNSIFANSTISDYVNDGLVITNSCCQTTFENITANSNDVGKRGVFIDGSGTKYSTGLHFISLSATHAGPGYKAVDISGVGAATPTDATNRDITIDGLYCEYSTDTDEGCLKVSDARSVTVHGYTAYLLRSGASNPIVTYLTQTGANQLANVNIYGYAFFGSGGSRGLVNDATSESIYPSTVYVSQYNYGGGGGGTAAGAGPTINSTFTINGSLVAKALTFNNAADVSMYLNLQAGLTADRNIGLYYKNHLGTTQWVRYMDAASSNSMRLDNSVTNVTREILIPAGASRYNSGGTGAVEFNTDNSGAAGSSGTGGVKFGSGGAAPTVVATVDNTGKGTFNAGVVPGTGSAAITKHLTGSAALDFANLASAGCEDLTITVTGAALGDRVGLGVPNASVPNATAFFTAWVSGTNTVSVRYCNLVSGDPASGTFSVVVGN